jgi:hypothetical protein
MIMRWISLVPSKIAKIVNLAAAPADERDSCHDQQEPTVR